MKCAGCLMADVVIDIADDDVDDVDDENSNIDR